MATTCTTTVVRSRLVVDKPNIICRYTFVVGHRSAGSSKHNTTIFVWLSAAIVHDVNVVMSSFRERWMHPEWGRFPHPTRARQTSCNAQRQIPTRWIRNRARWCTDSWFLPGGQAYRNRDEWFPSYTNSLSCSRCYSTFSLHSIAGIYPPIRATCIWPLLSPVQGYGYPLSSTLF